MSEDHSVVVDMETPQSTVSSTLDHFSGLDLSEIKKLVNVAMGRDTMTLDDLGGVEGVIKYLATDAETGIPGDDDDEDISARIKFFNTNFNQYPKTDVLRASCFCMQEAVKDPLIIILLVFTLVSLCFGIKHHGIISVWPEKGTELIEIVAVVVVSAVANYWPVTQSHHDLSASKYTDYNPQVVVVRKGISKKISIFKVVVGDVVFLKPGDQIPGEGLFINGLSLHLENVITKNGRTDRAEVGHENPFILNGNMVVDGYSKMVVTAVANTRKIQQPQEVIWMKGVHADELKNLTFRVGWLGKIFAASTFMCFLFRFISEEQDEANKEADIVKFLVALVGMLTDSAIIALTSSLEGSVLAVRTTLAYSMWSLWNDQVLIKEPSLSHQVASVDVICLNKTGTLTSDDFEVKKFCLGLTSIEEASCSILAQNVRELLYQAIGFSPNQPPSSSASASYLTSTEKAIMKWATHRLGMNHQSLLASCAILEIEPFNPTKKRSGVLISKNNTIHVHRKGAADSILPMCSHYYETTGIAKPIDGSIRTVLEQLIKGMEESGLRCIAFAHRKTSIEEYFNFSKQKLTLLGFAGLKNSLRVEVKKTVEDLQKAGINFKLLTGDSTSTATFMAKRGGLLDPDITPGPGQIVEGAEFRNFSPEERMEKVHQIRVLAKATPSDKLLMVESLKQNGRVVAYVGGGQGDVQALKEANVGICFGTRGGAEILKACSDIVIKKKDFLLVIEILKWGRGFYDSIQTYTQFLLTATFVDLFDDFVMAIFPSGFLTIFYTLEVISTGKVPVPVFQLLWVKLILGTVAALSVLIKQPSADLMCMPARDPNEPLLTSGMQRNITAQALYQIFILLAIHFKGTSLLNLNDQFEKTTAIFNTYVLCQVFTLINAKLYDRKNIFQEIHNKKWFWGIIGIITVLQVIMVEVWKSIAGTARLDARQWGLCIFMAAASTPISWLLRYFLPKAMNIPYLSSAKGSSMKPKID